MESIKIEKRNSFISKTTSYIKSSTNEQVDEFGYTLEGSNSDSSGELTHILTNLPATDIDMDFKKTASHSGATHTFCIKDIPTRKLFYKYGNVIIRIHDDVIINLGGLGTTLGEKMITSDLTNVPPPLPSYKLKEYQDSNSDLWTRHIQAWLNQRINYGAFPHVSAKALTIILSNAKNALLTSKTDVNKVDIENFGELATIDPDTLLNSGAYLGNHINKDGIITNLEINYSTGIVDINIFLRGY